MDRVQSIYVTAVFIIILPFTPRASDFILYFSPKQNIDFISRLIRGVGLRQSDL